MGEVTIKKWQCDCCRKLFDKRPMVNPPRVSIVATSLEEWHETAHSLKETCPDCNKELQRIFDALDAKVHAIRSAKK